MAPGNGIGEDLWKEAAQTLGRNDFERITAGRDERRAILVDILGIVKRKQEICKQKRWKYIKHSGEEVLLHNVFAKISRWINRFKEVGDNAMQYDPYHAALPWAAVRLVLQVCD